MNAKQLEHYRERLREMRDRMRNEVNHVAEAIREEVNVDKNTSDAPVHLADQAPSNVDADVAVLQTTNDMLEEVVAALDRTHQGTFGVCESCGQPITTSRLDALPYTRLCVDCAARES